MVFDPSLPDESVNVSQTSIVREALTLVVGAAALIVVAGALLALLLEQAIVWIPPSMERAMFGSLWDDAGDADDGPEAEQLRALFTEIVTEHPQYAEGYRIGVIENEMPNAFALPGGMIFFTTGLLDRVESENQVAFVIGHELGHFENRDHLRGISRQVAFGLVSSAVGFGGDGVGELAGFTSVLATRSFGRRQELAADRFGIDVLERHYGHGGGARSLIEDVLGRTPTGEAEVTDESLTRYLDTHPPFPERVELVERELRERGMGATGQLLPWAHFEDDEEEAATGGVTEAAPDLPEG